MFTPTARDRGELGDPISWGRDELGDQDRVFQPSAARQALAELDANLVGQQPPGELDAQVDLDFEGRVQDTGDSLAVRDVKLRGLVVEGAPEDPFCVADVA